MLQESDGAIKIPLEANYGHPVWAIYAIDENKHSLYSVLR